MPIRDVVDVTVNLTNAARIANGAGVPIILAQHTAWVDRFREYAEADDMLDDGFLSSDAAYRAAVVMKSQEGSVDRFLVGRRVAPVARVVQVTITTAVDSTGYAIQIDGVNIAITSGVGATTTTIRDQFIAAITALSASLGVTAAIVSAAVFSITGTVGRGFAITESDTRVTFAETVALVGAAQDLQAIADAGALFYGVMLTSRTPADQLETAEWVQAQGVRYLAMVQTSAVGSTSTPYDAADTDMLARLRALGYDRTAGWWHHSDAEWLDAALLGFLLPKSPGTETWALKRLIGVTASPVTALSLTGQTNVLSRNASFYYELSPGLAITQGGRVPSGQWIDQRRLGDAIEADISARVINLYVSADKIPMDDTGIGQTASCVIASLQSFEDSGALDASPKFSIEVPSEEDISEANRADRILDPPIRAVARSSGAIHRANINVSVTV